MQIRLHSRPRLQFTRVIVSSYSSYSSSSYSYSWFRNPSRPVVAVGRANPSPLRWWTGGAGQITRLFSPRPNADGPRVVSTAIRTQSTACRRPRAYPAGRSTLVRGRSSRTVRTTRLCAPKRSRANPCPSVRDLWLRRDLVRRTLEADRLFLMGIWRVAVPSTRGPLDTCLS